jgi:NAD(P)H-quinone oxidoreductase subunit 4L
MAIELLFAAASINFVAFNHFIHNDRLIGQGFALFLMTLAAAEAVVGLALILTVNRAHKQQGEAA